MIRLTLPFPPSMNSLWRSVNGRNVSSKKYRDWQALAVVELVGQTGIGRGSPHVKGPYNMTATFDRPDRRRRDLGNLEKAGTDLLVTRGIIADDCNAEQITLRWSGKEPVANPKVYIELEPL